MRIVLLSAAIVLASAACDSKPLPVAADASLATDGGGTVSPWDGSGDSASTEDAAKDAAPLADAADAQLPLDTQPADATGDTAAETVADANLDTNLDVPSDGSSDSAGDAMPDTSAPKSDCKMDYSDSQPAMAKWAQLRVVKGAGPCPPGQVCQWTWTVKPDGSVQKSMAGVASTAQMDAAALQMLNADVSSQLFQSQMANGFGCGTPPTDVSVAFERTDDAGQTVIANVTGCIMGAEKCNNAKAVWDQVTAW